MTPLYIYAASLSFVTESCLAGIIGPPTTDLGGIHAILEDFKNIHSDAKEETTLYNVSKQGTAGYEQDNFRTTKRKQDGVGTTEQGITGRRNFDLRAIYQGITAHEQIGFGTTKQVIIGNEQIGVSTTKQGVIRHEQISRGTPGHEQISLGTSKQGILTGHEQISLGTPGHEQISLGTPGQGITGHVQIGLGTTKQGIAGHEQISLVTTGQGVTGHEQFSPGTTKQGFTGHEQFSPGTTKQGFTGHEQFSFSTTSRGVTENVLSHNATILEISEHGTSRNVTKADLPSLPTGVERQNESTLFEKRAQCFREANLTDVENFACHRSLLVHYSLMQFWTHYASEAMCQNQETYKKGMECMLGASKGCLPPENRAHFPDIEKAQGGLQYICEVGQYFNINVSCAQKHFRHVFDCVYEDTLLVVGNTYLEIPIQPELICRTYDIADLCCWEILQVCGKDTAGAYTRVMSLYLRPPSCWNAAMSIAYSVLLIFVGLAINITS